MMEEFVPTHIPVLPIEVIDFYKLIPSTDSMYFIDGTGGEGGHSLEVLKNFPNAHLLILDRDQTMLDRIQERLGPYQDRFQLLNCNFSELDSDLLFQNLGVYFVHGILLDLGISTYHLLHSERGFSFAKDEFLDMRVDETQRLTAFQVVNKYPLKEIMRIFKEYGEEKWAKKIVENIGFLRKSDPIETTKELANLVARTIPRKFWPPKTHPALRIFQALRIEVNSELKHLESALHRLYTLLEVGGVLSVISFHSLEDRIVKNFMKEKNRSNNYTILTKKPISPTENEIQKNHASRSAKLRAIQRKLI